MRSLVIALGITAFGVAYVLMAWQLPRPRPDDVIGPGATPLTLGAVLIVLTGMLALSAAFRPQPSDRELAPVERAHVAMIVALVVYVGAIAYAGFTLATAVFLLLCGIGGRQGLIQSALFAVATTVTLYVVFEVLFKVSLPRGSL